MKPISTDDVKQANVVGTLSTHEEYGCLTRGICSKCVAYILSNSNVQKLVITKMVESLTSAQLGDMLQRLGFSTCDEDMRMFIIAQLTGEFK